MTQTNKVHLLSYTTINNKHIFYYIIILLLLNTYTAKSMEKKKGKPLIKYLFFDLISSIMIGIDKFFSIIGKLLKSILWCINITLMDTKKELHVNKKTSRENESRVKMTFTLCSWWRSRRLSALATSFASSSLWIKTFISFIKEMWSLESNEKIMGWKYR